LLQLQSDSAGGALLKYIIARHGFMKMPGNLG